MSDFVFDEEGAYVPSASCEEFCDEDALFQVENAAECSWVQTSTETTKTGRAPLVTCHICQKQLFSVEGYRKHLNQHITVELFLSAPKCDVVTAHCRIACKTVLQKYITCPLFKGGFSGEVIEAAKSLLNVSEESRSTFVDHVIQLIWNCLPKSSAKQLSGFHSAFNRAVNRDVISDPNIRATVLCLLKHILGVVGDEKNKVLRFLVGDFLMKMASAIESYYLKCIREPRELFLYGGKNVEMPRDHEDDPNVQGSIYYIGGSTIRSVLNKGLRASSSHEWKKIVPCLIDNFISGPLAKAPMSEVTGWTESRSRGGLIFISEPAWSFLMALSQILVKLEKPDGSILHTEVYKSVKNNEIIYNMLWCDLVGEKLSEEERDFLLQQVCESFTNTWGVGVVLRRTNAMKGSSRDKVALRPSLL